MFVLKISYHRPTESFTNILKTLLRLSTKTNNKFQNSNLILLVFILWKKKKYYNTKLLNDN
jgi:hypothetical protein